MRRYGDDTWRRRLRAAVVRHWKKHWAIAEDAGVTPPGLSRILTGRSRFPSFDLIFRIARAADISVGRDLLDEQGFELTDDEQAAVVAGVAALQAALARARSPLKNARAQPNAWKMKRERERIPRMHRDAGARVIYHATGDSMLSAGVADGDMLFVRPCADVRESEGRVIVAELGGDFFVKRLGIREGRVFLDSADEGYAPIEIREEDRGFRIIGIVVGRLLRFD